MYMKIIEDNWSSCVSKVSYMLFQFNGHSISKDFRGSLHNHWWGQTYVHNSISAHGFAVLFYALHGLFSCMSLKFGVFFYFGPLMFFGPAKISLPVFLALRVLPLATPKISVISLSGIVSLVVVMMCFSVLLWIQFARNSIIISWLSVKWYAKYYTWYPWV